MDKEELIDIFGIIGLKKQHYLEIKKWLKLKNVNFVNEKGEPITMTNITEDIIKDLESISNVIYENNKRY